MHDERPLIPLIYIKPPQRERSRLSKVLFCQAHIQNPRARRNAPIEVPTSVGRKRHVSVCSRWSRGNRSGCRKLGSR
jgi:hypothetical protein